MADVEITPQSRPQDQTSSLVTSSAHPSPQSSIKRTASAAARRLTSSSNLNDGISPESIPRSADLELSPRSFSSGAFPASEKGKEAAYELASRNSEDRSARTLVKQVSFSPSPEVIEAYDTPTLMSPFSASIKRPFSNSFASSSSSSNTTSPRRSPPEGNAFNFTSDAVAFHKVSIESDRSNDFAEKTPFDSIQDQREVLKEYTRRESLSHFSAPTNKWDEKPSEDDQSDDGGLPLIERANDVANGASKYLRRWRKERSYSRGCCGNVASLWKHWWFKAIIFTIVLLLLGIFILAMICLLGFHNPTFSLSNAGPTSVYQSDMLGISMSRDLRLAIDNSANFLGLSLYRVQVQVWFEDDEFGTGSADPQIYVPGRSTITTILVPILYTYTSKADAQAKLLYTLDNNCSSNTTSLKSSIVVQAQMFILGFVQLTQTLQPALIDIPCDKAFSNAIHNAADIYNLTQRYNKPGQ